MARLIALLSLTAILAACAAPPVRRSGFVLERGSDFRTPAWLGNGRFGFRFRPDGAGVPDRAYFAPNYESGGEERLPPSPNPFAVEVWFNERPERPKRPRQRLDLRSGILTTTWETTNLSASIEAVVHPALPEASVQWTFKAKQHGKVELRSIQDRDKPPSWSGAKPEVVPAPHPEIQRWSRGDATIRPGETRTMGIVWGGGSGASAHGSLITACKAAAKVEWSTDIEIDGPAEDQMAVRAALWYLRRQTAKGVLAVSPMGMSSHLYGGHVFWDADVWVLPALALIDPARARAIADFRLERAGQAAQIAEGQGAPRGAAAFPWESGLSGLEVGATIHRRAAHLSGSVLIGLHLARQLGLAEEGRVRALGFAVAKYYRWRSRPALHGLSTIDQTLGPDETGLVDGDLYTNAVAEWCRRTYGREVGVRYRRPRDQTTFLTHEGDALRPLKQASAVLAAFPLQDRAVELELDAMLSRFAPLTLRQGPAMSSGVHALLWARAGQPNAGYEAWLDATRPFGRALGLFNEKRNLLEDRTFFATGAACGLNAVIYGFLGLRIDDHPQPGAIWSLPLRGNGWISARPRLPRAWKSVTFRNFRVLDRTFTLTVNHHTAKVEQGVP